MCHVLAVARALEAHYDPAKMNYQLLGNGNPHLHVHLVLRHHNDVAPGRPLPPAACEAGTANPVPDAELAATIAVLRDLVEI